MIARLWHGITQAKDHQAYLDYLHQTGVPEILKIEGNRGIHLLHRRASEDAEFLFISFWDSYDSIRKYAGPNAEIAVYYPEDRKYLRALEPGVAHFEMESFEASKGEAAGIQAK